MASETCFSSAGSAQQRDNELFTLREDVGLLDKEALVNTGDDAQETENVSFLSKPKVFNRSLCLFIGEAVKLAGKGMPYGNGLPLKLIGSPSEQDGPILSAWDY